MRLPVLALVLLLFASCSESQTAGPGSPSAAPVRVLMLTATAGFRHDSIPQARQSVSARGAATGEFVVTATEDVSALRAANLASYDVVFFALTSGELSLSDDNKAALLAFVSAGRGFVGAHSATDTLYGWPEYGALIGAYFKEHPWTGPAAVVVEDGSHPATASLPSRFTVTEEFYTFRDNPRPNVQVLLRLDPASVGATGDYPLAWARTYGQGRVYYNALGHFAETWRDDRFLQQISGAIKWAGKR